jgi:glycogen synthase
MHVLLLGPYPPPHGGVQTNLVAIRRLLIRRRIAVSVVNLTGYRRQSQDGVWYPKNALQVLWLLFRIPATIIHLHIGGELPLRLLLLSWICCLLPGRKALLTFHSGGYPSSPAGKTASPRTLRGFVLRRFDGLIAINRQLETLFHQFGVPPGRIRFILPYALPHKTPAAALPVPIAQFFDSHQPVLLSMGWLETEYDYPLQIRALARLRCTFPAAGLAIFGIGRLEAELRALAAETGAGAHVLFAGDVPHPAALAAMAQCAIFLRTTLYDGDSISVREALHLGVPVIATDNGMRPDGVTLVPVGDEDAVVQAASNILQRPKAGAVVTAVGDPTESVLDLYTEL